MSNSTRKVKKVFPVVKGTEVSIEYKNNYGNIVAVNIGDNGLSLESPIMTEDLKIKIKQKITLFNLTSPFFGNKSFCLPSKHIWHWLVI